MAGVPSPWHDAPVSAWSAGSLGCPRRARPHWLLLRPSLQLLTTTLRAGAPFTQEVTQPEEQDQHPLGDTSPGKPGAPSVALKDGAVTTVALRVEFSQRSWLPLPPRKYTAPMGSPASPGDLRLTGQQLPPPRPDGLGPAVCGGSTQGMGGLKHTHTALPLLPQTPPPRRPYPRPRGEATVKPKARPGPGPGCRPSFSHSDLCPLSPVPGLHLRPSAWHPQHPRHQEPGHHLCGSPASL